MKDYLVTAWNNNTHWETSYVTDNYEDAMNTANYYRRRPKHYSNVKIETREWDDEAMD